MKIVIKFIIIAALSAQTAFSQQYNFEHLFLEEGITHNLTYSILQDSKGFMWFGTFYGLIRYDGRDYTNFKHEQFDTNSVSSDDIISLYEDRNGFIWVGTWSGGLNRFDPNTETFTQFFHDPMDSLSISNDIVYSVCEDNSGRLWVATKNGLNRFVSQNDPLNKSGRNYFVRYYYEPDNKYSLNNNDVRALYRDSKGRFWVGVFEGGLHLYSPDKDNFSRLEIKSDDETSRIMSIFEDNEGTLWLATWGGGLKKVQVVEPGPDSVARLVKSIYRYDPANENSISNDFIWTIEQDKTGKLWVGTTDGLNVFDPKDMIFNRFFYDAKNSNTISSNKVSAIKIDQSGVLWIGTFRGGIDRIVPGIAQFESFFHNPFDPNSLIDKEVTSLMEDRKKNIWVGTVNGITQIKKNGDDYNYSNIIFESGNPKRTNDNYITSFIEDKQGNIWVGTNNGLNCIHPNGSIERYDLPILPDENELGNIITSLLLDSKNRLWVGTVTHGLNIFHTESKTFTSFRHDSKDASSISTNYIFSLYEDSDQNIWVGTYSGLNKLISKEDPDDNLSFRFQKSFNSNKGEFQVRDNVFCIYEDHDKTMWIGTNEGLISLDKILGEVTIYNETDGLPSNVICGILEANDNFLWASTHKGISSFNKIEKRFNNYYTLHGLQGNVYNTGAYYKSADGKMMFGGENGFNAFYPQNISSFELVPPVVLTSFKVFDEEKKFGKRLSDLSSIELTYEENFFTITFAALDYRLPERNQFYYFLEGFDRDWIFNETKNYASYTNLDPGEYTFHVRGSNSNGIWNNEGKSIKLIITPPFWQTWWFKSSIALVVMVLLLLIIYLIQHNEKRKTELNKKISQLKLQALRAQMNPHFIFNTINSIQYFISCNDQESAFLYLSKFSKLMRQTLENSAKSRISIQRELEALTLYMDLQKLRFEKKFDYKIEVDPQIDVHNYEIPTMLIQPYIENAINHGISKKRTKGFIRVALNRVDDNLSCVVEDDGIGILKSQAMKKNTQSDHTSSGMRLTFNRLQIINDGKNDGVFVSVKDLSEEDCNLSGTKVSIKIPLETHQN